MIGRSAILDSNYLVAELDQLDVLHRQAVELREGLEQYGVHVIFLDLLIGEAISVIARRYDERRRPEEFPPILDELRRRVPPERIT